MPKPFRATQATELNVISSLKYPMMKIQNTHRKAETSKMCVTLSGCILEGDATKGISICDRIKLFDHSASHAHLPIQ
jgi:hypothetical protein